MKDGGEDVVGGKRRVDKFSILAEFDEGNEDCSAEIGEAILDVTEAEKRENSKEEIEKISRRRVKVFGTPTITIKKHELWLDDLAQLCHSFFIPIEVPRPGWFRTTKFKKPSHLVLARINCTEQLIRDENNKMQFLHGFFGKRFTPVDEEVCDSMGFWKRLMEISLPRMSHIKHMLKKSDDPIQSAISENNLKLQLLTSVEQMMFFNYPLTGFTEDMDGIASVVNTRQCYGRLTETSPVFVVDCEMCQTTACKSELTRVTLIDEEGNIVIDSFVKPKNKITDYVTCFSGVTKESLEGVTVTVEDVQETLQRVLPPNAILVGHSIENDLMAMRVSHPYCIDVGLIYSSKMNRRSRQSLKKLADCYLGETIQSSDNGHCSYEDCWATLQLFKLKLKHGIVFGSVADGFDHLEWTQNFEKPQKSNLDDQKKTYVKNVKLPPPKCVGHCVSCGSEIKSQCCVEECLCMKRQPKKCILCAGKGEEYQDPDEHERFNYGVAIKKFVEKTKTPINEVTEAFTTKKALFARYMDNIEAQSIKNVTICDMTDLTTPEEIKDYILDANVMENDLCVIEYNAEEGSEEAVDQLLKHVHNSMAPFGILALVLCTTTRAIMHFGVKI
ncbi:unnamed protein product [Bursaphelenchus okinawaensis]|uniref:Exonuclease domain-containing protein n=1 Tax=Bursaphelenchus okinawaensis TaxID=465554 RepID=A0A811LA33_9BILA|nr:unnamed protein product [Bursaphelenchus okinawaensis]CAG9119268.1 unnamed protein product [Bursaphelenchus okinawaensis]